ncbi:hypothetical protein CCR75_006452 [Bremia lactucae]|uniref:RWP-RK domain-containing protein n=1 Tax=Bremia lactucae TaxID=4779 RepID=A0A976FN88_BRELC|nr:hypothetical protein CCR75_006452 [Bremia lactucae]
MTTSLPAPPATKTPPQPVRKSRRKFDFSIKVLQEYSHYRQDDAARLLGVAPITLKRNCQRLKYRWPYRSIKAKLRREGLTNQKQTTTKALAPWIRTAASLAPTAPELLLSLSNTKERYIKTGVIDATALTPSVPSYKARFLLANEPNKRLPPLSFLLRKPQVQSRYRSINYKSTYYSASFHPTAPKFPTKPQHRLLPLVDDCASNL